MTEADLCAVALAEAAAVEIILTDLVLAYLARTTVRCATFLAAARLRPLMFFGTEAGNAAGASADD